eukprot:4310386-Pyramimonas_sp.AAC.1
MSEDCCVPLAASRSREETAVRVDIRLGLRVFRLRAAAGGVGVGHGRHPSGTRSDYGQTSESL